MAVSSTRLNPSSFFSLPYLLFRDLFGFLTRCLLSMFMLIPNSFLSKIWSSQLFAYANFSYFHSIHILYGCLLSITLDDNICTAIYLLGKYNGDESWKCHSIARKNNLSVLCGRINLLLAKAVLVEDYLIINRNCKSFHEVCATISNISNSENIIVLCFLNTRYYNIILWLQK